MNCLKKNTECFMYVTEPVASVLTEMNRSKSDKNFFARNASKTLPEEQCEKKKKRIIIMCFLYTGHN